MKKQKESRQKNKQKRSWDETKKTIRVVLHTQNNRFIGEFISRENLEIESQPSKTTVISPILLFMAFFPLVIFPILIITVLERSRWARAEQRKSRSLLSKEYVKWALKLVFGWIIVVNHRLVIVGCADK